MQKGRRTMEFIKNKLISLIVIIALLAGCILGGSYYLKQRAAQKVDADSLYTKLEDASDLTTQKMIYNGVIESESGSIPFLTKETFLMTYKATIRAGFDVSKTDIKVTENTVEVSLPAMEIQEVTIDPDEIKTYNTSLTLIKPDGKEELKQALTEAEANAKEEAKKAGLLDAAAENAESVIKGLFAGTVGDREIVIKHGAAAKPTEEAAEETPEDASAEAGDAAAADEQAQDSE